MTAKPTKPKTPEQLDEMRARAIATKSSGPHGPGEDAVSRLSGILEMSRQADEAAGIPTEGLLAVMRGEAVIVQKQYAMQQGTAATKYGDAHGMRSDARFRWSDVWDCMLSAARTFTPKKEQDNG